MEYQATAKYIRTSARKVRLIARAIRTLSPQAALLKLKELPKQATIPLSAVISSALANAKTKQANLDNLSFKTIEVMGGPVMKRWQAVSRGQAHGYKKRMTHIRIILTEKEEKKEDFKK